MAIKTRFDSSKGQKGERNKRGLARNNLELRKYCYPKEKIFGQPY